MKNLKVLFTVLCVACTTTVWGEIAEGTYTLCTSTSDLETGAHYIIASGTSGSVQCISNVTNNNNRKIVAATVENSQIVVTSTSTIMTFTLGGTTGAWTLSTDNYAGTGGYLASAASGSNNYCRVINTETTGTISFSDNAADIKLKPHSSRNILRYNSSASCFACYSSGQAAIYLYKLSSKTTNYTVQWMVGGAEYTEGNPTTEVASGSKVTTLPTAPADNRLSCAEKFMGWSTTNIGATPQSDAPEILFTTAENSPNITANTIFYAVFATKQTN